MRSIFKSDYLVLSKLFFIFRLFGSSFLHFHKLCFVIKRFVFGEKPLHIKNSIQEEESTNVFSAEAESLLSIVPNILTTESQIFKDFNAYGLESNFPTGCFLVTKRTCCRSCMKKLSIEKKHHIVVVYDLKHGVFLGARVTKICRQCKINEHYGYWTLDGKKHYDADALQNQYLLSSDETAFDVDLLKDVSSLLVVGAVPFSTYASSFNRRFDLRQHQCHDSNLQRRVHGDLKETVSQRSSLDRRRLEEGFLLFAALQAIQKHQLQMSYFPCDRNEMAKMLTEPFHSSFRKKWGEHCCDKNGCQNVIVLDGNMKNCRQVCSCKNITLLEFDGMNGGITVGCINTPSKGSRFCDVHNTTALTFRDDLHLMNDNGTTSTCDEGTKDDLLPITIVNDKQTRNGHFFEIMWSNGCKTWVKDIHLPPKIQELLKDGHVYQQTDITVKEIGQKRKEFTVSAQHTKSPLLNEHTFKSHGFAIEHNDDIFVQDGASKKRLTCGTEKGKHKCKNAKTAGILVFERPCGVVIDVCELFGSESKSQVYAHLHTLLMAQTHMQRTEIICYDDACHLKKFTQNPCRSENTETAKKLSHMEIVCDRFHFKNHIDRWCRNNCNPYNSVGLKDVNTEVCEQLFSWLSNFGKITKHMNRWRFLFTMLYILDCHNEDVTVHY